MRAAYYDQVFFVPVARPARAANRHSLDAISEREFSDELRDPRFLSGWFLLPAFGFGLLAAALFA